MKYFSDFIITRNQLEMKGKGTITKLLHNYGFLSDLFSGKIYFFHFGQTKTKGENLRAGDIVTYSTRIGRGNKIQACCVEKDKAQNPPKLIATDYEPTKEAKFGNDYIIQRYKRYVHFGIINGQIEGLWHYTEFLPFSVAGNVVDINRLREGMQINFECEWSQERDGFVATQIIP